MNVYRIYRTDEIGLDQFDSAIVAAVSEHHATTFHPNGSDLCDDSADMLRTWQRRGQIQSELIGKAKARTRAGVILASFNAG